MLLLAVLLAVLWAVPHVVKHEDDVGVPTEVGVPFDSAPTERRRPLAGSPKPTLVSERVRSSRPLTYGPLRPDSLAELSIAARWARRLSRSSSKPLLSPLTFFTESPSDLPSQTTTLHVGGMLVPVSEHRCRK